MRSQRAAVRRNSLFSRAGSGLLSGSLCAAILLLCGPAVAVELEIPQPGDKTGYEHLIGTAYTSSSMDPELFENLWQCWEEPLRSEAAIATPERRRELTLIRYGLTDAPGREGGIPLQFAPTAQGEWALNCFACHGGKVAGQIMPGLPNTHIALETLVADSVRTRQILGRQVRASDATGLFVPLGKSNGTTNAVIFGVALAAYRDRDLNFHADYPTPPMLHNDHDAPPWWHVKRKDWLYADGFAGKGHRALMQFMLTPSNGPEVFHNSENDYQEILAWIEQLEPPKYPWPIDQELAATGEVIFNNRCAECHGTYGEDAHYPEAIVPLEVVGTDRVRLDSLTTEMRASYEDSWFSNFGEKKSQHDPGGYIAQPLDGIWASAPYLHNGSVPTLWHLFHPEERPVVWQRTEDGYDTERVGLEVTAYERIPSEAKTAAQKRTYFDTRIRGKSAKGHLFPAELAPEEKLAVMEYLKTL